MWCVRLIPLRYAKWGFECEQSIWNVACCLCRTSICSKWCTARCKAASPNWISWKKSTSTTSTSVTMPATKPAKLKKSIHSLSLVFFPIFSVCLSVCLSVCRSVSGMYWRWFGHFFLFYVDVLIEFAVVCRLKKKKGNIFQSMSSLQKTSAKVIALFQWFLMISIRARICSTVFHISNR